MRKTIFAIMAIVAMVACSKDEVVNVAEFKSINFSDAFVDNSTRAALDESYVTAKLNEFQVYATITGNGANEGTANIFRAERVIRGNSLGCGTDWSYSSGNTQYWIPGNTYNFRAIAEGNVANVSEVIAPDAGKNMATAIKLNDASAQKDILFAEQLNVGYSEGDGEKTVSFTFNHIMAKAKFTIKNTITTNNGYSYKVSNISLNDVAKNGVYTFDGNAAGVWAAAETPDVYDLQFGNAVLTGTEDGAEAADIAFGGSMESNYERLLIPFKQALNITFDYQLLKDGVVIDTQTDCEISSMSYEFKAGHAYNFVIQLGNPGNPIKFSVTEVNEWIVEADSNI